MTIDKLCKWFVFVAAPIVILALIVGCASDMVRKKTVDVATIHWIRATPEKCGGEALQGRTLHGCAKVFPSGCVLTMAEDAPDWLVAHEVKHCFGWDHR